MHEKKRVFKILGTNYNLVKEAGYCSNAAVISPRTTERHEGYKFVLHFSFLEIDCSRGI